MRRSDTVKNGGSRVLFALITALLVSSVAVIVATGGPKVDPARELAAVRSYVAEAETVRFTMSSKSVQGDADDDGLGSTYTDRTEESGEFEFPDRSHVVSNDGEVIWETVIVP